MFISIHLWLYVIRVKQYIIDEMNRKICLDITQICTPVDMTSDIATFSP